MRTLDFPHQYKNFVLKKKIQIDEIQSTLFELEHLSTHAKVIHISHDDDENLFSLSFKTYPASSNGVAHILEHTVLCGSSKFPVKDPFFSMTRRSLNTFMNAMTGMDFTCYPAASQNKKDFYHLLDVYLDAVFYPILDEMSFLQEGHRLEFSSKNSIKSPLTIQGIVYNEMKGSMNSPESRMYKKLYEALFPDLPYRFNSGGDPSVIPNLTYKELKDFHHKYYHPSQCVFFFYGNLPLEGHLDFIEEHVLAKSDAKAPISPIPKQPRFQAPKIVDDSYPVPNLVENQDFIALGFLTTSIKNQTEYLALCLLEEILMESDASYLKSRLQKSGLTVQADSFLDGEMSEIPFVFVMRGTKEENAKKLEHLLLESLEEFIQKPIEQAQIEAALHQLMLERLEITDEQGPFGLSLFMRAILLMQHGANPEEGLFVHRSFDELKKNLKDPHYLPSLVQKYFLNNPHRVLLRLKADCDLEQKENAQEKEKLEALEKKLTEKEKQSILQKSQELARFQKNQEEQDLDILPQLEISDISSSVKDFPLKTKKMGNLEVYHHATWTNDFIYADIIFDLPKCEDDELSLLKFLLSIYTELGFGNQSYEKTLHDLQAYTGGLSAYFQILTDVQDPQFLRPMLGLKGKALKKNSEKFFHLLKEGLLKPKIDDPERIKDLISQTYTYLRDKINRSGLAYCIKEALSGTSVYNYLNHKMSGIPYFHYIEKLHSKMKKSPDEIISHLKKLYDQNFAFINPKLIISTDQQTFYDLENDQFYGLGKIEPKDQPLWSSSIKDLKRVHKHLEIASPVSFNCEAYSVFTIQDELSPALTLATSIMDNAVLHPMIREQGGAYGSGATYQSIVGNFYFHSYRDPNVANTYEAFKKAIKTVIEGDFDEQMIKDAKFEFIQDYDAPITPGMRAQTAFFYEKTHRSKKFREDYKKRLLSVSKKEIQKAVEKAFLNNPSTCVFACSKEVYSKEKALLDKMHLEFITEKILK